MADGVSLHTFLIETLALWGVSGEVTESRVSSRCEVLAANGTHIWIERAGSDTPFRWLARWRKAGDAPGGVRELRPRACSGLVGLLAALREALDVDRGSAVRIVPAPVDSNP